MVIDAGPFHVLTQRPGAGEPGAVGSTAELTGVLVSVREYEFEAFDLPDVRQRWRVLSVRRAPHFWAYEVGLTPLA